MNYMKSGFVFIMTTIIVLFIYLVADTLLVGFLSLIVLAFNRAVALQVFKWGMIILFSLETIMTVSIAIKKRNEGDEE